MQSAELFHRRVDDGPAIVFLAHIAGSRLGAPTFATDCGSSFFRQVQLQVGDHHGRAFARAHDRGRAPVAYREWFSLVGRAIRAAAYDQGNLAVESAHRVSPYFSG